MKTTRIYIKIWFVMVSLMFPILAKAQVWNGIYSNTDGSTLIAASYNGDGTYEVVTMDSSGQFINENTVDEDAMDGYVSNSIGYNYETIVEGDPGMQEMDLGDGAVTDVTADNEPVPVGYAYVQFADGSQLFQGRIGSVIIGSLSDPTQAAQNFNDFTDSVGSYIELGGTIAASSLFGLTDLFSAIADQFSGDSGGGDEDYH